MIFKRLLSNVRLNNVKVGLPGIFESDVTVGVNQEQRNAAWQLYVELETRVIANPLREGEGSLREDLNSLYQVFGLTREILRNYKPSDIAQGEASLGSIAIAVLNKGLRPFLGKWHQKLKAYEENRSDGVSVYEHERNWEHYTEMRQELKQVQDQMQDYRKALAQIVGIEHEKRKSETEDKNGQPT